MIHTFKAHENRIKSLKCVKNLSAIKESDKIWLISASSDGFIKLWDIDMKTVRNSFN